MRGSIIRSVDAMAGFADNGQASVIATVVTENGAVGQAACCVGTSVGANEAPYLFDGGEAMDGKGVFKAVESIKNVLGPALIGQDAANQSRCDEILLGFDKAVVGANAMAALSCAVLKAGAKAMDIPLYRQLGGSRAFSMPLPEYLGASGRKGLPVSFCFLGYGSDLGHVYGGRSVAMGGTARCR